MVLIDEDEISKESDLILGLRGKEEMRTEELSILDWEEREKDTMVVCLRPSKATNCWLENKGKRPPEEQDAFRKDTK